MTTKVTVVTSPRNRISINNQERTLIRSVGISPTIGTSLAGLTDVDASDPNNNETLVYDETTGKYVIKTLPIINGGIY